MVYDSVFDKNWNIGTILDSLWDIFNTNHPKDYEGRSMGVSDIVILDNNYYYCDSCGWKLIK